MMEWYCNFNDPVVYLMKGTQALNSEATVVSAIAHHHLPQITVRSLIFCTPTRKMETLAIYEILIKQHTYHTP